MVVPAAKGGGTGKRVEEGRLSAGGGAGSQWRGTVERELRRDGQQRMVMAEAGGGIVKGRNSTAKLNHSPGEEFVGGQQLSLAAQRLKTSQKCRRECTQCGGGAVLVCAEGEATFCIVAQEKGTQEVIGGGG